MRPSVWRLRAELQSTMSGWTYHLQGRTRSPSSLAIHRRKVSVIGFHASHCPMNQIQPRIRNAAAAGGAGAGAGAALIMSSLKSAQDHAVNGAAEDNCSAEVNRSFQFSTGGMRRLVMASDARSCQEKSPFPYPLHSQMLQKRNYAHQHQVSVLPGGTCIHWCCQRDHSQHRKGIFLKKEDNVFSLDVTVTK